MLSLSEIPVFKLKDLTHGVCGLTVAPLGSAENLPAAWALLPESGEGVVVCADHIRRFRAGEKSGLLLDADVSQGSSTTILRSSDTAWQGWLWSEVPGDDHRYVEHIFVSSEPGKAPPNLVYRQYWQLKEDDGIQVWAPVGSRFCGFQEA
jgi:hypothetical protein